MSAAYLVLLAECLPAPSRKPPLCGSKVAGHSDIVAVAVGKTAVGARSDFDRLVSVAALASLSKDLVAQDTTATTIYLNPVSGAASNSHVA